MATVADILRESHRLRRHAKDLRADIERGPRQLEIQRTKVKVAEEAKVQAQDALKKLKVATHERETSLKATNALVAKHERQLNEAAGKKEYDALKTEIATDRAKALQLEDDILAGMMAIEEQTARLPELDKAIQKAQADFAEFERTYQTRQDDRAEMLQKTLTLLTEVEQSLTGDIRSHYERSITARGEDALSAVEGNSCVACFTSITAQNMNELRVGQFVVCKSCGRILYLAS